MNDLSVFVPVLFAIITGITSWQFYNAAGKSIAILSCLSLWIIFQAIIGLTGFYQVTDALPPRFLLLIGPGLALSVILLLTKRGRRFMDSLDLQKLTLLHAIRIPVEITLYFVYAAHMIPLVMTFEGNNYDIISGLTAPVMYYLVFIRKTFDKTALLIWNFACLGLLLNILVIAILSARTPFQQLAFDQPNIGVTLFPFVWLPSVVVPIVLIAHLSAIRQLIVKRRVITSTSFLSANEIVK